MAHCNGCGTDKAISVFTFDKKDENNYPIKNEKGGHVMEEVCDICSRIKLAPNYLTDAEGNRLAYSDNLTGKYSYATDSHWTSKRALSEHCKRHGLVQKGDAKNTKDKRGKQ
jgi:hypothetical protein